MERPRVKTVFPPMPVDDRTIAIGGADFGLAAEFEDDEQRHLWHLFGLLDGTRTRSQIVEAFHDIDPQVSADDIDATLDTLVEAGYLEDGAIPPPSTLSPEELVRYRRNAEFFTFFSRHPENGYHYQERLKQSRVTVLGVGGLGSYVALALGAAGVGNLQLVDDDVVEEHNLNRQVLYTSETVGSPKVFAARDRIAAINPHVTVTAVASRVSGVDDARACVAGQDLLVCAADRPRIRIYEWINKATITERVPWIRGANDGLTVNTFLHVPGETACFACTQNRALATIPRYGALIRFATQTLGDRTVNPCTAPVAGLIGSLTAMEAVKLLTGATRPAMHNRKLTVDLQTLETRFADGVRDPDCPACGHLFATETEPA